MTDELKAYVNAYMDGLEVEYRFNEKWYVVESFSDFDDTNADYRIEEEDHRKIAFDNMGFNFEECFERIGLLEKHVTNLDDTVTRLVLENAKQAKQLKNHERVWDRIDRDVQLFGNKVVGYELDKENEDD
jgi:hypothetical protein